MRFCVSVHFYMSRRLCVAGSMQSYVSRRFCVAGSMHFYVSRRLWVVAGTAGYIYIHSQQLDRVPNILGSRFQSPAKPQHIYWIKFQIPRKPFHVFVGSHFLSGKHATVPCMGPMAITFELRVGSYSGFDFPFVGCPIFSLWAALFSEVCRGGAACGHES